MKSTMLTVEMENGTMTIDRERMTAYVVRTDGLTIHFDTSEGDLLRLRGLMQDEWHLLVALTADPVEAAAGPVPAGHKVEVEGDIVSIKTQSNKWGETVKMLVKLNNGAKVWGTCPSTFLEADVSLGDRVKFVAGKIDASRDDASFGFFSRPTRAKIMAPAA